MKKQNFAILLATFVLAACGPRPTARCNRNLDEPMYYAYNPEDTVGNEPYWLLLRIDSARVDFRLDHPVSEMATINLDSTEGEEKTPEQLQYEQSVLVAETEAKWFELMRLCSQRLYEDALSFYIKEETDIGIALATSTNKFDLDYFVIGPLLFEQLDEEEAAEIMVKFLEYDKFLTESVVLLGESQLGYVPPQYAFQLEILSKVYLKLDEWEKAEALIEPYRKAVYLLSDDTLMNEYDITGVKLNIYADMDDGVRIKEALVEYRAFLVQYAKDTHQDMNERIEKLDDLINSVEE
ncbi:MAG: hypothetical protein IKW82_07635 [Bacteroidales bacterium]|nr:hypothetical protein [Bacteroidales bacterium]